MTSAEGRAADLSLLAGITGVPARLITPEIETLLRAKREGEQAHYAAVTAHTQEQRRLAHQIDDLLRASRPEYPTKGMLDGVSEAIERISRRTPVASHLGDPTCSPLVTVETRARRINVAAGAPLAQVRQGMERVWSMTDTEVQAIRDHIVSLGATIVADWPHEDGHGFIVFAAEETIEGVEP